MRIDMSFNFDESEKVIQAELNDIDRAMELTIVYRDGKSTQHTDSFYFFNDNEQHMEEIDFILNGIKLERDPR